MIASVETILKCRICESIIKDPVILSCGLTVCKEHADKTKQSIWCPSCNTGHSFQFNNILAQLLDFGIGDEKKQRASHLQNARDEQLRKWNEMVNDVSFCISENFNFLRSLVLLNRELIILNVDEECDELLKYLTEFTRRCTEEANTDVSITSLKIFFFLADDF